MGKTGRREDGDLLSTGDRIHGVDGRNTGGDHFFGVHLKASVSSCHLLQMTSYSRVWVDRATVDVEVVLSKHLGAFVNGLSRSIKDTTQHVLGNTKLQAVSCELDFGLRLSDISSVNRAFACTFLTSMPDVPSKTCVAISNVYGSEFCRSGIPGRLLGHLYAEISFCALMRDRASLPRASRTCPERSVPSGSVRETISLKRGNLTCPPSV